MPETTQPDVTEQDVTEPDDRTVPPITGDERATLLGFLDFHRDTLRWKCAGLDARQLATRAVPTSALSLLGIVRHMADVELGWFSHHLAGGPADYYIDYSVDGDAEFNFGDADDAMVAQAWANFDEQIEKSDEVIAAFALDDIARGTRRTGEKMSLRWILVHLVEEYARHNGHADLLREAIDGATGE